MLQVSRDMKSIAAGPLSLRPSLEPLLKKEASPAVFGGREFRKCSGGFKCLARKSLGGPSHTLEANLGKSSPESPSYTGGYGPERIKIARFSAVAAARKNARSCTRPQDSERFSDGAFPPVRLPGPSKAKSNSQKPVICTVKSRFLHLRSGEKCIGEYCSGLSCNG